MLDTSRCSSDMGHLVNGLALYADHGKPTGGFLRAVLSNDFGVAVCKADENSTRALREIAQFVRNEMPSKCHGSPEKVKAWIKSFQEYEDE